MDLTTSVYGLHEPDLLFLTVIQCTGTCTCHFLIEVIFEILIYLFAGMNLPNKYVANVPFDILPENCWDNTICKMRPLLH